MTGPALHFDGPMIAGGAAYELAELSGSMPETRIATGTAVIDEVTGGIGVGSVWAVTGAAGLGVTSVVNQIAAHVALGADVVVCNGHVPTRALAADLAGRIAHEQPTNSRASLRVASWYALSHEPSDEGPLFDPTDLLVVDTWDETWHATRWPANRSELVRPLRWFRHLVRERNAAVLLTARTPSSASDDALGWMREALDDVADVRVDLQMGRRGVEAHIRARGGRAGRGILRAIPNGPTTILRD